MSIFGAVWNYFFLNSIFFPIWSKICSLLYSWCQIFILTNYFVSITMYLFSSFLSYFKNTFYKKNRIAKIILFSSHNCNPINLVELVVSMLKNISPWKLMINPFTEGPPPPEKKKKNLLFLSSKQKRKKERRLKKDTKSVITGSKISKLCHYFFFHWYTSPMNDLLDRKPSIWIDLNLCNCIWYACKCRVCLPLCLLLYLLLV